MLLPDCEEEDRTKAYVKNIGNDAFELIFCALSC